MKKIFSVLLSLSLSIFVFAQDSIMAGTEKNASGLRAEGKIYVVLAVAVTILLGLFYYLIRLDRKIGKMERETANGKREK